MKQTKGFTLIELLVVIAIIGILATVIITSLSGARDKTNVTKTAFTLKEIEKGLFAATLEENRNTYWTIPELGGSGTFISFNDILAIEYPNPGWAIKNYLNQGHTRFFTGGAVNYRNQGGSISACSASASGISLRVPLSTGNFSDEIALQINKIIDGEESNLQCGKFRPSPGTSTSHSYVLARNATVIDF